MVAKIVFTRTKWCSTRVAFQLMGRATTPGLPDDVPPIICPNALVNMNDWYWSTPSSSQIAARISCRVRRMPGTVVAAAVMPGRSRHTAISLIPPLSARTGPGAQPGMPGSWPGFRRDALNNSIKQ